ncbi:MAG: tRNA (adenosine(37)-N6)-threonylcarbamoyltransferase complex ATPase subunit type 1 TsaE [Chloroflexi bacterium]|nr:tRNA (adenosine(37)-N6)-threonylcarbamoyltransferase complex ATPase subunit type 1 TsaE [Chloroflexota bacterium]
MVHTPDVLEVLTEGEEETRDLGSLLARVLRPGDVVALQGNLGAGKTRLIQGIARGLGITRPVTSPTFVLMNVYPTGKGFSLCHVDTYRLGSPVEEGYDLGLDQLLRGEDICVIEWAERIRPLLPADHMWVEIQEVDEHRRRIILQGTGPQSRARVGELAKTLEHISDSAAGDV